MSIAFGLVHVVYLQLNHWEILDVQTMAGSAVVPVVRLVAPQPVVVLGTATPAAPIEPARRVTPGRQGGRTDLTPQQGQRNVQGSYRRGRLIDLSI